MRPHSVTWSSMPVMLLLATAHAVSGDLDAIYLTSTIAPATTVQATAPGTPTWQTHELDRITQAGDFHVTPYRDNHVSLGIPAWTWSVAVDGELYVRAYNGTRSGWYQSAIRERAGQISAAGMKRLVAFEAVQGAINEKIDQAYRAKYGGSRYLDAMLSERASAATVRIRPAD
jgi:hypothetical protein